MGWFRPLLIVGSESPLRWYGSWRYSGDAIGATQNRVDGESMGVSVLTAEHCPFGGYRQTVQCLLPNTFSERG